MEHALKEAFFAKNELVKNGQIVKATEMFFAPHATTSDFDGTKTLTKEDMLAKRHRTAPCLHSKQRVICRVYLPV